MNKNEANRFPGLFNKIRTSYRFPLRVPIGYGNFNCGTLLIDFEPKPFGRLSKGISERREQAQLDILSEIFALSADWKNDIELTFKLRNKYQATREDLSKLIFSYDFEKEVIRRPPDQMFYIFGDDLVLDFIRSEGPQALRVLDVMAVLVVRWLNDPKRAGTKLEGLNSALLEYMTGKRKDEIRFPDGRPPSEAVKLIGKKIITEFYEDLTSFLKLARKKKGQEHYEEMDKLRSLIKESTLDYISFLETSCRLNPDDHKSASRLQRILGRYRKKEDQKKAYTFVFDCLKGDPELLAEFNIRSSKPNYIAKEIIGRLIGVSADTITNVLYRKNIKKETKPV